MFTVVVYLMLWFLFTVAIVKSTFFWYNTSTAYKVAEVGYFVGLFGASFLILTLIFGVFSGELSMIYKTEFNGTSCEADACDATFTYASHNGWELAVGIMFMFAMCFKVVSASLSASVYPTLWRSPMEYDRDFGSYKWAISLSIAANVIFILLAFFAQFYCVSVDYLRFYGHFWPTVTGYFGIAFCLIALVLEFVWGIFYVTKKNEASRA